MKKQAFILLILTSCKIYCQDLVYLDNNTKLQVKILEKSDSLIKFKKLENLDGPNYTIRKNEITLIIYSNGEHEVIKKTEQSVVTDPNKLFIHEYWRRKDSIENHKIKVQKEKLDLFTKDKNILFCNLPEFANVGLGVDYIREMFQQRVLLFACLSVSGGTLKTEEQGNYNYGGVNTIEFQTKTRPVLGGLGILFNTGKRSRVSFNLGPGFKFAQYTGTYNNFSRDKIITDSAKNIFYYEFKKFPHSFVANKFLFDINAHLFFRIFKKINIMAYVNINVFQSVTFVSGSPTAYESDGYNPNKSIFNSRFPTGNSQFGLDVGYRFSVKKNSR